MTQKNWRRFREGELNWHLLEQRAAILRATRDFFQERGYLEFDAPLLTPYPTLDANILSLETVLTTENKKIPLYLHTSPEHAMKKYLVAGAEKIFFLGKVFRNDELTRLHNPEFTMVEWYRTQANHQDIQEETEALILHIVRALQKNNILSYQDRKTDLSRPWATLSLIDLFREKAGIDLNQALDTEGIKRQASHLSCHITDEDDWESCFHKIYLDYIEPDLGSNCPVWISDYPSQMGLMAKRKTSDPRYVERIELFIGGMELANGYSELTDPEEQNKRFVQDQFEKQRQGLHYPVDDELIEAMQIGMPTCSGIALGFDRLMMLLTDTPRIEDILTFPLNQSIRGT